MGLPVDKLRFDVADTQPAAKKFVNILRNSVFCCVARHSPSKLVRHHVMGEIGFHASDSVVGIHDFVGAAVASDQPTAWVDVESTHFHTELMSHNMVLSMQSFPLQSLLLTRLWSESDEVFYDIKQNEVGSCVPDECKQELPGFLGDIVLQAKQCRRGRM